MHPAPRYNNQLRDTHCPHPSLDYFEVTPRHHITSFLNISLSNSLKKNNHSIISYLKNLIIPSYQHISSQYFNFLDCLMIFFFVTVCLNPNKLSTLHLVPISQIFPPSPDHLFVVPFHLNCLCLWVCLLATFPTFS